MHEEQPLVARIFSSCAAAYASRVVELWGRVLSCRGTSFCWSKFGVASWVVDIFRAYLQGCNPWNKGFLGL